MYKLILSGFNNYILDLDKTLKNSRFVSYTHFSLEYSFSKYKVLKVNIQHLVTPSDKSSN